MSITVNGTTGLNFPDGTSQPTAGFAPFRNRIINGDMRIDQRNEGAALTPTTAGAPFIVDRFNAELNTTSALTFQRSTDVPAGSGFTNSLRISVNSSTSVVAGSNNNLLQLIEGYNIADLAWGTANAKPATISFWIKSSVTGTYSLHLRNSGDSLFYIATYTVTTANTWEYKTITIPGPTTGTWNNTNGRGVLIGFVNLGNGANFEGTAGSWQSGVKCATSGSVDFCARANGSTIFITGVQFERGEAATAFEHRPFGTELALCQRYCEANAGYMGAYIGYKMGGPNFHVIKRAVPTVKFYTGSDLTGTLGSIVESNVTGNPYVVNSYQASRSSITLIATSYSSTTNMGFSFLAECEL